MKEGTRATCAWPRLVVVVGTPHDRPVTESRTEASHVIRRQSVEVARRVSGEAKDQEIRGQ